ncbi:MAG: hypothetical protein H7834_13795, partial [Magnetococcus sp. YQC-9]
MAPNGTLLEKWGATGTGPGFFVSPYAISLGNDGHVFVTDTTGRTQEFTADGQYIQDRFPDNAELWSAGPVDMQITATCRDVTYTGVTPEGVAFTRTHLIDQTKHFGTNFACPNFGGTIDAVPNLVKLKDRDNNVYVMISAYDLMITGYGLMDMVAIQKVSPSGELLAEFLEKGNMPGQVEFPSNVMAVSPEGKVYVVDKGNSRIQIISPSQTVDKSKAIIVAGGGAYPGNNLWTSTEVAANFAFRTLTYQGFTKSTIQYLSSNKQLDLDGNGYRDEVDTDATLANLQEAITTWAADAENVFLYLTDHGGNGTFRMSATETLTAASLSQWLDELQSKIPGKIIVIYDACESGSFLNTLRPPANKADKRVVMTSTSPNESAAFISSGAVSFSNYFWTNLFNGLPLANAFQLTQGALQHTVSNQHPLLDANGNGVANEAEDFAALGNLSLGNGPVATGSAPVIGQVMPNQQISDTNEATIWAKNLTDDDGIQRVWAVIRPPNFQADNQLLPLQSLPEIELQRVGDRYEGKYLNFTTTGTYQVAIYAQDKLGNSAIPELVTVSVNNPQTRKALIIAGGDPTASEWKSIENKSALVFSSLKTQGYSDEDIQYLSATIISNVDALASRANLTDRLTNWAATQTQDLVIYLTGAGGRPGTFQLNSQESITAAELTTLLNDLQTHIPGKVTVIVDADYAGGLIPGLKAPLGKERIVIGSTSATRKNFSMADGKISFSQFFWKQVVNGATVRDAFLHAKKAVGFAGGALPQLDDNGNGIANERNDGRLSRYYNIGIGILLAGDDPMVGEISAPQVLNGTHSATIQAKQVTITGAIQSIKAVIISPDPLALPLELPMTETAPGIYSVTHDGFALHGDYNVSVFVTDTTGHVSLPAETTVTQTVGKDVLENDDTREQATVIVPNDPIPQDHNIHKIDDVDWVKFYAVQGKTYAIKANNPGIGADLVIDLYDQDGNRVPLYNQGGETIFEVDDGYGGEEEIATWTATSDGIYYARIRQFETLTETIYGSNTDYQLQVYEPTAPGNPGIIQGIISSDLNLANIAGALIKANTATGQLVTAALSTTNGMFSLVVNAGTVNLQGLVTGYDAKAVSQVQVNAGEVVQLDLTLTKQPPTIQGTPATEVYEKVAYRFAPVGTDPVAGTKLTYSIANKPAWAQFDEKTGILSGTPQEKDVGKSANIVITITDGKTPQSLTPFDLTVLNINSAPAGADKTVTTPEDTDYTFTAGDFGFTDPNDTPANQFNRVKISTLPGAGSLRHNGVAITTAGIFVSMDDITAKKLFFVPASHVHGANHATFTFQVEDDGGTANGGINLDPTARTMTLDVTSVNNAPSGANKTVTTQEDTDHTFTAGDFGFTDPNDTPANGFSRVKITTLPGAGTLKLTGAVITTAGTLVTVNDISAKNLIFSPASNASGIGYATFTFQVEDDGGTDNHGVNLDPTPRTLTIDVTAVNDSPTGGVTITGTPTQGQTLTADTSTLKDADGLGTLHYQWKAGSANIGTNAATLVLTKAEAGKAITVVVSYTDGHNTAESVTSTETTLVANVNDAPTGGVTITGTPTQGQTLTADTSTLKDADGLGTLHYQWKAGSANIGTNAATLVLTKAEAGKAITVVVSYTDGHNTAESVTSTETALVANVNDAPTGGVTITGIPTQGQTLTAITSTLKDADGLGTFQYQWKAGTANIGTDSSTLVLTEAEAGKAITVMVSYTDGHNTVESVTSAATALVVGLAPSNTPPTLAALTDLTVKSGQTMVSVPFTATDAETPVGQLTFTVISFNHDLVPDGTIMVVKVAPTHLEITPVAGKTGSAVITLTVSDGVADPVSRSFTLTVEADVSVGSKPLSGVIKNASGTGVANVLVRLLPEFDPTSGTTGGYLETYTDSTGHYLFNAKPGRYRVEFLTSYRNSTGTLVTLPGNLVGGFANGAHGVVNGWDGASVLQFGDTTQLDATLDTGLTLSGTVKTSDDKPVVGANIILHTLDWSVVANGKSQADGSFTSLVRPGLEYRMQVFPAYCETSNTDAAQGCGSARVDFQGGQWVQSGTTGETLNGTVTPGDDALATKLKTDNSLVLAVKVDLGQKVTGRVVEDGTGAGLAYAWVDSPVGGVPTDANGYFSLTTPSSGLPSGFKLSVFPGGHEDPTSHAWLPGTAFIGGSVTGNSTSGFALTSDPSAATILTVWPNQALGDAGKSGLKIVVAGGITIQGSVKSDSNGLANIWVNAHAVGSAEGMGISTQSDGSFAILLPAPASGTTVWYEVAPWSERYLSPEPVLVSVTSFGVTGVYAIDQEKSVDATGLYKPVAGSRIGTATTVDLTVLNRTCFGMRSFLQGCVQDVSVVSKKRKRRSRRRRAAHFS